MLETDQVGDGLGTFSLIPFCAVLNFWTMYMHYLMNFWYIISNTNKLVFKNKIPCDRHCVVGKNILRFPFALYKRLGHVCISSVWKTLGWELKCLNDFPLIQDGRWMAQWTKGSIMWTHCLVIILRK